VVVSPKEWIESSRTSDSPSRLKNASWRCLGKRTSTQEATGILIIELPNAMGESRLDILLIWDAFLADGVNGIERHGESSTSG
jgi:hypothetical protein